MRIIAHRTSATSRSRGGLGQRLCNCQHRRTTFYEVSHAHLHLGVRRKNYVGPRTKLDKPDTLPALKPVAYLLGEYDAPRQQAGYLFEDNDAGVTAHGHNVLLVVLGRDRAHGVAELALLVADLFDHAADRRAVDVDVKDVKEDADTRPRLTVQLNHGDVRNLAVSGGYNGPLNRRNAALRIAKEPQKEGGQQHRYDRQRRHREPRQ